MLLRTPSTRHRSPGGVADGLLQIPSRIGLPRAPERRDSSRSAKIMATTVHRHAALPQTRRMPPQCCSVLAGTLTQHYVSGILAVSYIDERHHATRPIRRLSRPFGWSRLRRTQQRFPAGMNRTEISPARESQTAPAVRGEAQPPRGAQGPPSLGSGSSRSCIGRSSSSVSPLFQVRSSEANSLLHLKRHGSAVHRAASAHRKTASCDQAGMRSRSAEGQRPRAGKAHANAAIQRIATGLFQCEGTCFLPSIGDMTADRDSPRLPRARAR